MKAVFLDQFARIGKALSNPSRLALLDLLCQCEKSVEVLVEQSHLSLKNTSAQLKVLREAGLITARKDGKNIFYSLSNEQVAKFWSNLQEFSSRQLAELQIVAKEFISDEDALVGVNRKELIRRARLGDVTIIDVRPNDEYLASHIPFAISLPLEQLKARLKSLPKNREIVAYCRGPYCLLAVEAVRLLKRYGFRAARLEDGIHDWKSHGLPVHPA
jgi:rhodanese-related sulfurtransferase